MKKTSGAHVPHTPPISFEEWEIPTLKFMQDRLAVLMQETLENAVKQAKVKAYFPIEWDGGEEPSDGVGGKPPAEATTIYVGLPFEEIETPYWSVSLSEMIDDFISFLSESESGDVSPAAVKLRDGLRELADRIDKAIAVDSKVSR